MMYGVASLEKVNMEADLSAVAPKRSAVSGDPS
jgi:hypothetical protein